MIVGQVSGEGAPEMRLIQDDHVIETLAPNGSDQPFDVGILPRTRRARDDLADAVVRHNPGTPAALLIAAAIPDRITPCSN